LTKLRGSGLMVDRGLCVTSGSIVKLVCWRKVDTVNNECEADCDTSSSN